MPYSLSDRSMSFFNSLNSREMASALFFLESAIPVKIAVLAFTKVKPSKYYRIITDSRRYEQAENRVRKMNPFIVVGFGSTIRSSTLNNRNLYEMMNSGENESDSFIITFPLLINSKHTVATHDQRTFGRERVHFSEFISDEFREELRTRLIIKQ